MAIEYLLLANGFFLLLVLLFLLILLSGKDSLKKIRPKVREDLKKIKQQISQ
jgi:hypothetical protein